MIPELGHFSLIIALSLAIMQSVLPLIGAQTGRAPFIAVAVPAARAQFLFVLLAFASLTWAFVSKDFSVQYVATNSNAELPLAYRISAVWGAHEGSLLLWVTLLSCWTVAVTVFSRGLPEAFVARVVAVMGMVSIGFLLFMLLTSNPFARLLPAAAAGRDLNPLLQDFGLVIHPPMLYMGYVGLSVPFSFAVAALIQGRIDTAWTRWTRPWTTISWVFLTLGIALGSWWAYYELGWGGWWFWDPVENASFMPWLIATALIHSLAVTEQRGAFKAWTLLLAIFGFSLSLLGTFLVRSGVLVSVHAFATDPSRGIFILVFLGIVIGAALALYAWRATQVSGGGSFELLSRETLLLTNNVLLTVTSLSILLGTMYPLIVDALSLGKISVGPPYFNRVFVPLMLPLALLLGVGPMARWKKDSALKLTKRLRIAFAASLLLAFGGVLIAASTAPVMVVTGIAVAIWVVWTAIQNAARRFSRRLGVVDNVRHLPRGFVGMTLAHIGVGIFIIGATASSTYSIEKDVRLAPGAAYTLGDYTFRFDAVTEVPGPNYTAERATFTVTDSGGDAVATLEPEKRFYPIQRQQPMTEAGIEPGLTRDLYIALGEKLGGGAWSIRIYYKPLQRWIWLGPLLMAIGGLIATTDRRYRLRARSRQREAGAIDNGAVAGVSSI